MSTPDKKAVPRLPKTFVPDYGGRPVPPWYERVPPLKFFVVVGAVIGFVIGIYRSF